jgi:hypothetical protein
VRHRLPAAGPDERGVGRGRHRRQSCHARGRPPPRAPSRRSCSYAPSGGPTHPFCEGHNGKIDGRGGAPLPPASATSA